MDLLMEMNMGLDCIACRFLHEVVHRQAGGSTRQYLRDTGEKQKGYSYNAFHLKFIMLEIMATLPFPE